jgi:hydrogenase maturation protease
VRPERTRGMKSGKDRRSRREAASLAVLGIGNLIYSDDGAGLEALRRLENDPRLPAGVRFIDASAGGLEVAARIGCASRLLILDAVDVGAVPGTVVRLTGDQLSGLPAGACVHRLGISDLLSVLRLTERMPEEVILLGVQPASIALGTVLSPAVESGVRRVAAEALAQIAEWAGDQKNAAGPVSKSAPRRT